MIAEIKIFLRKSISDPQGFTVRKTLNSIGLDNVKDVRVGKYITLDLGFIDIANAKSIVETACEKLLANPVLEDYSYVLEDRE